MHVQPRTAICSAHCAVRLFCPIRPGWLRVVCRTAPQPWFVYLSWCHMCGAGTGDLLGLCVHQTSEFGGYRGPSVLASLSFPAVVCLV